MNVLEAGTVVKPLTNNRKESAEFRRDWRKLSKSLDAFWRFRSKRIFDCARKSSPIIYSDLWNPGQVAYRQPMLFFVNHMLGPAATCGWKRLTDFFGGRLKTAISALWYLPIFELDAASMWGAVNCRATIYHIPKIVIRRYNFNRSIGSNVTTWPRRCVCLASLRSMCFISRCWRNLQQKLRKTERISEKNKESINFHVLMLSGIAVRRPDSGWIENENVRKEALAGFLQNIDTSKNCLSKFFERRHSVRKFGRAWIQLWRYREELNR